MGFAPRADSVIPASVRLATQAALLGTVYAALSTPAAYTSNAQTLAALIWPAPAVAVALLWNLPWRQWPIHLLAVFAAMLFVGDRDGLSLGADTAFALLNVFEVMLYTLLGRRFVGREAAIHTTRQLTQYLLFLPLLATAVVACLGASIGAVTKGTLWLDEWKVMMVGNGLAILVLLPALLAWFPAQRPVAAPTGEVRWTPATTAALVVMLLLALSAVLHPFPAELLRAALALVLVGAAIRGGLRAASTGVLTAAALGIGLTLAGLGPYSLPFGENRAWELQVDLAGLAVLTFFVAVALNERQQLNLRLERARRFEAMGFLSGGIAHDFNNILAAVGGYAELATEREQSGLPVRAALGEVSAAVSRGRDLTEQILLLGRQGGRHREWLDLRDVVTDAVALARPQLPPGVQLTVRVPSSPLCTQAHRSQITRAVLNLLRNASQAARQRIDITLAPGDHDQEGSRQRAPDTLAGEQPAGAWGLIDVSDDGLGIPSGNMHRLFDPFFTSRSGTGQGGKGTGLGLAIVAGVAADHTGGVAVWSGAGEPTCFRLMLLLTPAALAAPSQSTPGPEKAIDANHPIGMLGAGDVALLLTRDDEAPESTEAAEEALAALGFEPVAFALTVHADTTSEAVAQHLATAIADAGADLVVWLNPPDTDTAGTAMDQIGPLCQQPDLPIVVCRSDALNSTTDTGFIVQNGSVITVFGPLSASAWHQAVKMALSLNSHAARPDESPSTSTASS